jgi:eyes absent family protein 4
VVHVAVTSGQLVPSLAKLLLFKLGAHIAPTNVWSSRHCGKAACFDLVRRRFGPACTYVAIGARCRIAAASHLHAYILRPHSAGCKLAPWRS